MATLAERINAVLVALDRVPMNKRNKGWGKAWEDARFAQSCLTDRCFVTCRAYLALAERYVSP